MVGHFRHTDLITHSRTVLMQHVAVSADFYSGMSTLSGSCALKKVRKGKRLLLTRVNAQLVSSRQQSSILIGPFAAGDAINIQQGIVTWGDVANRSVWCKTETRKRFKRTAIYSDKTPRANVQGNPLYIATK